MLQFDEYKVKLNNLTPALKELAQALDLESASGSWICFRPNLRPMGSGIIWPRPRRYSSGSKFTGQGGQSE